MKPTTQLQVLLITATLLLTLANSRAGLIIPGLFNTGVDDSGAVLPLHSLEQHYTVSGAASLSYLAPVVFHSPGNQAWVSAPSGSAWIGPNPTDSTWPKDPTGMYYYTLKCDFSLTGVDASKVQISGLWAGDGSSQIWVNNQYSGFGKTGWASFTELTPFLLQGQFNQGFNTLEVRVSNEAGEYPNGNPSGLLVAGLTATVVPEPSTFVAGALLLLPFAVQGVRRLRKTGQSSKGA